MTTTKKILFSVGVIAIFVIYVIFSTRNSNQSSSVATQTAPAGAQPTNSSTTSSGSSSSSSSNPPSKGSGSTYKDGNYTGSVADNIYGNIQVSVTIYGGRIADVNFLQYPDAPGHTTQVSNMALPQLQSEAIAAQSANVNIVSGATQDSQAFQQSLASALAQAQQ